MKPVTAPLAGPSAPSHLALHALGHTGAGRARTTFTLIVIGAIAWIGLVFIGVRLAQAGPPGVGFDLELLIDAGRNAASGTSMYSGALVAGETVEAQSLFYSYPPFVGQLMALIAWLPSPVILIAWAALATAAMCGVGVLIARRLESEIHPLVVVVPLAALAPLVMPYAIGVLFGNFNVFFPAVYGLVLLAVLATPGDRRTRVAGGIALGIAAATKVHPASLALWFLVRGLRERRDGRRPDAWEVLATAAITGLALVGASVLLGGTQPWLDYVAVVRASSGATLLDHRNYGPAAELGLLLGINEMTVRLFHLVVLTTAVVATVWAAWTRRDVVESLGVGAVASLAILPVTWIHYPAALIPFAVALLVRTRANDRSTRLLVAAAGAALFLAIVVTPLLWVGIGLFLVALFRRSGNPLPDSSARPATA
jgi:hypothetical protein